MVGGNPALPPALLLEDGEAQFHQLNLFLDAEIRARHVGHVSCSW